MKLRQLLSVVFCSVFMLSLIATTDANAQSWEEFKEKAKQAVEGTASKALGNKPLPKEKTKPEPQQVPAPASTTSTPQSAQASATAISISGDYDGGTLDGAVLFKMFMATHGDFINVPAVANKYYTMFEVAPNVKKHNSYLPSEECRDYQKRWQNSDEFSRPELIALERERFQAALDKAKSWPKSAVFKITGKGKLQDYDAKTQAFPVQLQPDALFNPNTIQSRYCYFSANRYQELTKDQHLVSMQAFGLDGYLATKLSSFSAITMSADAARAYLKAHRVDNKGNPDPNGKPNRQVKLEGRAEVGPIVIKSGRIQPIGYRVVEARLVDPMTGAVLASFAGDPVAPDSAAQAVAGARGATMATDHYLTLQLLRDHPENVPDEWLLKLAERQITWEQSRWRQIDQYLENCQKQPQRCTSLNAKRSAFIYEWQTLVKTRPALANGALLDVFQYHEADWSFVKQEPEWDDRFQAVVSVFLFARDDVEDKNAKFAARALLPIYRQHLLAVASKAPRHLYMAAPISEIKYDFDKQKMMIVPLYKGTGASYQQKALKDLPDLLKPVSEPALSAPDSKQIGGGGVIVYPPSIRSTMLYTRPVVSHSQPYRPGALSVPGLPEQYNTDNWRKMIVYPPPPYKRSLETVALDRQLALTSFAVSTEKGEQLTRKFQGHGGVVARVIFDVIRTDLGKRVYPDGKEQPSPVLLGKLVRVDLVVTGGEVVTSFGAKHFPPASDLFAVAEAKAAKAAKAKQSEALQAQTEKNQVIAQCEVSGSQFTQLKCKREAMCQSHRQLFEADECRSITESYQAMARVDSYCRSRFRELAYEAEGPREGTPAYAAAMETCYSDPLRQAYGPDIVDLRLGMENGQAHQIIMQRFGQKGYRASDLEKPKPFERAMLFWDSKTADQGIALFMLRNHGEDRVAGISRRLYFGDNEPKKSKIVAGLRKKYGTETLSKGDTLLWAFPQNGDQIGKQSCAPALDLVTPRGQWQIEWRPPGSAMNYKMQYQQSNASQMQSKILHCVTKIQAKYQAEFSSGNQSKMQQTMAKMQQEMAACQNASFSTSAGSPNTATQQPKASDVRMPLMIGAGGSPETYNKLKACGPIIVTVLNTEGGLVKDASFTLFDPSWIGLQPSFLFEGDEQAAGKDKQKDIDF